MEININTRTRTTTVVSEDYPGQAESFLAICVVNCALAQALPLSSITKLGCNNDGSQIDFENSCATSYEQHRAIWYGEDWRLNQEKQQE